MVFEVPASKRSIDQDVYPYKIGGKTFKVTSAKYLNGFQMEAVANGDLSGIFDIFGKRDTPAGDAVRGLDQEQLTALIEAWTADAGVSPGESKAS